MRKQFGPEPFAKPVTDRLPLAQDLKDAADVTLVGEERDQFGVSGLLHKSSAVLDGQTIMPARAREEHIEIPVAADRLLGFHEPGMLIVRGRRRLKPMYR